MGGGLMQLVAYGAQDIYLTGNPQITFFKVVYRRHTNFAVESIAQTFNGTPGYYPKQVSCTISRNGDLITDCFLEIVLTKPASNTSATWWPAEALIQEVSLDIGGQTIDKHNSTWFRIFNELFRKDAEKAAYERMVNFTEDEQKANGAIKKRFYLPLIFFFNRNPGLALPLIALTAGRKSIQPRASGNCAEENLLGSREAFASSQMLYHEVKINIKFQNTTIMQDAGIDTTIDPEVTLWVDYVYLDTDERRRFAQVSHEYLITQIQHTGDETALVNNATQNLRLNLNHPCKYLTWVFANPNRHGHFAGNAQARTTTSEFMAPLASAKLQLNGHDRATTRMGSYFNYTQPFQTLKAKPQAGINLYTFSIKPDEHQPSGTCNMSRIDNATLVLAYKTQVANSTSSNVANVVSKVLDESRTTDECKDLTALRLYAENYNVLRIMSGINSPVPNSKLPSGFRIPPGGANSESFRGLAALAA
ncbi:Major capsid protein [Chlorella vulgaris]